MRFPLEKTPALRGIALAWAACAALAVAAEKTPPKEAAATWGSKRDEPMVEVAKVCPGIVIDLRYASERNVTGKAIYPPNARCLVRQSVALRLNKAQEELRAQKLGLKIWDAYRPAWAQQRLWDAVRNPDYVGEPSRGGSLHTYGVGVDVTLVDAHGRDLPMPTDFDDFSPAAGRIYKGGNPAVARNLFTLQKAMVHAGFWTLRDEWWHFVAEDVKSFGPVDLALGAEPKVVPPVPKLAAEAAAKN